MKKKSFDCVEMKRACQRKLRERAGGMTRSEELRFFREAGRQLEKRIQSARESERRPSPDK